MGQQQQSVVHEEEEKESQNRVRPSARTQNLSIRLNTSICNSVLGMTGAGKTTVELYPILRISCF